MHLVLLVLSIVLLVSVASFAVGYLVRRKNDKDPVVSVGGVTISAPKPDPKAISPNGGNA